jgi:hypothetical protein
MPKAKPDQVIVHRIELQDHERDSLDLLVGSLAARNLAQGAGSLLDPLLKCSLWGAAFASTIWGIVVVENWIKMEGEKREDATPFYPRGSEESAASYRSRTTWGERANYIWEQQRDFMLKQNEYA